jgi:hypothetical protein
MAEDDDNKIKVKLIYPHAIGDRIVIFGAVFIRDGEHHYAFVDQDLANQMVTEGHGEIIN